MKKMTFAALFTLPLLAAGTLCAGEFDVDYRADSLKLPTETGFQSFYQTKDSKGPKFCGLTPNSDGVTVLHLDNRGTGGHDYPFFRYVFKSDLRQITLDCKVRITDPESKMAQFMFYAVLPDPSRERNRLALVMIDRDKLRTPSGVVSYEVGDKFHTFRLLLDAESNKYELYDLDTGKLIKGGNAQKADPKSPVNSFAFGDGSSTVRGTAEVVEVRAAANKLLRPGAKN